MVKMSKRYALIVLVGLMACNGNSGKEAHSQQEVPYFNGPDFTPIWDSSNITHRIGSFELVNQQGRTINNQNVRGKYYIADFFFTTCPGICLKLTKHMQIIQKHFEHDTNVLLLSHSVMPSYDTPEVLSRYADLHEVNPDKWHLLTGEVKQIYRLARESYFADEDFKKTKDSSAFVHTENFVLVDPQGRIRGVYNGTLELEAKRAIRHLESLMQE